jgi:CheY-like chemotaxis protein
VTGEDRTRAPRATSEGAPGRASSPRPVVILVAEDEDHTRRLLAEVLSEVGYTVLTASDGRAALALARVHEDVIELLLTDIAMPHLDGRELAARVQRERPGVEVVFMSGRADPGDEGLSGRHFIAKPFEVDQLIELLGRVLAAPRALGTAPPGAPLR